VAVRLPRPCPDQLAGTPLELLDEVVVQLTRLDLQEQIGADPVRLDHPRIERIADARRASDQAKVRHRAGESTQQLGQATIDGRGNCIVVQCAVVVATAVARRLGMKA
jgi:hypothetical protein